MSDGHRTIRILLHLTGRTHVAVGVIESTWSGPVKVSKRYASLRPIPPVDPCPRGVDPVLWMALHAMRTLVQQQQAAAGEPSGH